MADKTLAKTIGADLLKGFPKHLRYARASEASTLFINDTYAAAPPYLRIEETDPETFLAEDFDGKRKRLFHIASVERTPGDLVFELVPIGTESGAQRSYTVYPYRDIDDTFVVIQAIADEEEKPVRWAIPAQFGYRIEVMPEGYP